MDTRDIELELPKKNIALQAYYPFLESGPLFPLLDNENTLFDFYIKANRRNDLKHFCKKTQWTDKPNVSKVVDTNLLKKLIHSMCNSPEARQKLTKSNNNLVELYQAIWMWLRVEHYEIYTKISSICKVKKGGRHFIDITELKKLLNGDDFENEKNKLPLTYITLAFAMLQKELRVELCHEIACKYPELSSHSVDNIEVANEIKEESTDEVVKEDDKSEVTKEESKAEGKLPDIEIKQFKTINSVEDLIFHEGHIEQLIREFIQLTEDFTNKTKKLTEFNSVTDFNDSGDVSSIITSLECNRKEIKIKYEDIQNLEQYVCSKKNCHECNITDEGLNPNESIKVIIRKLVLKKNGLKKLIEKIHDTKEQIEKLKVRELHLISTANFKIDDFSLELIDESPCTLIKTGTNYQDHIDSLNLKISIKLQEYKDELNYKIGELTVNFGSKANDKYLKNINEIKQRIVVTDSLNDCEAIEILLAETSFKYIDKDDVILRDTARKLVESNSITLEGILEVCKTLNAQNKQSIAYLLLYVYQLQNKTENESSALATDIFFDAVFNSSTEGLPLLTAFDETFSEIGILSFINGNINSKEQSERIVIMLITAALNGHSDSAFSILVKINAVEISRFNLPKYLDKIIGAIVSHRTIKFATKEFLDNMSNQEQIIEEQIAFEDGKYTHIQRDTKHFSRFESRIVYPALTELWGKISLSIKKSKFQDAHKVLDNIDIPTWYQSFVVEYDKQLIEHHHYSANTKKLMESFIFKLNEHLLFCEKGFDSKSLMIVESTLIDSFTEWAGKVSSRITLVNDFKKLIHAKNSNTTIKPFWHAIAQCKEVVLNCPNFILWLRKECRPSASSELMTIILNDLSNKITLDKAKELFLRASSWESISILYKSADKVLSKEHRLKFEVDKAAVIAKGGDLLELETNKFHLDLKDNIAGSRLPAAYKVIQQYNNEIEEFFENEKSLRLIFIKRMLDVLSDIKDEAARTNMSNGWLDSIFAFSAKIDRNLRTIQHPDYIEDGTSFNCEDIERSVDALKSSVETQSQNFDEIEFYLTPKYNVDDIQENPLDLATQKCPNLIKLWHTLSSTESLEDTAIKRTWSHFVKEFAKISNLYHDEHDDKKRFGVVHSSSSNYTYNIYQTAFYKPQSEFLKRPVRLYLYRNNVDLPALKRLEDELNTENSVSLLHIIFVPQGLEKIQRFLKYDKGFKNFLLVSDSLLYKVGSLDKHEIGIRQALHASVSDLANSSPFVSQGYCHQANNIYVGRNDILQKLLNSPQAMIWGGRRIGKTSVLHALENALNNRHYRVAYVYVDIQDNGDPDLAIAKKIAETLELGPVKDIATFEKKVSKLRRSGAKIAFLIDEVDEYIKKSRQVHPNEFPLATVLRQLVMDDPSKDTFLVYSGYHQLYYEAKLDQEKRRVGHPFINVGQPIPIKDLTYDDINELVKIGFEDMLGIKVHPSVPRHIAKRASRHPAFVQQFCRCLLEHVSNRRTPGTVVTITVKDVEAVFNTNVSIDGGEQAFIHYFNETLGYNLSHLGHAILLAVTDPEFTEKNIDDKYFYSEDISNLLNEWCNLLQIDKPKPEHFRQTIELLIMTNMLTQDTSLHDRYRATYPTHLNILKRLDKINMSAIEDSLKKYDEKERNKGILL